MRVLVIFIEFWAKRTSDKDGDYALIRASYRNSEGRRGCSPQLLHRLAPSTWSRRRFQGEGDPFTDTSPSACLCTRCPCTTTCATKRLFIYGRDRGIVEESHASFRTLLYICMHVPTRNVPFFSIPRFCLTLTPSYFAQSRLVVTAADNATARMADSQLMCNPSCWRSLRFFIYSTRRINRDVLKDIEIFFLQWNRDFTIT